MLMFVCPTVSENHFYECCHPCYKYLYTIVCMAEFKKCIVLNIFSHPKRIWASSCIYTWVGPDTFVARYRISDRFLMPDIRFPVGYLANVRYPTKPDIRPNPNIYTGIRYSKAVYSAYKKMRSYNTNDQ